MSEPQSLDSPPMSARAHIERGWGWLLAGMQPVRANPPQWLGMSAIYLLLAVLVGSIPFAGFLLVVMISPMLLGSALLVLHEGPHDSAVGDRVTIWLKQPARRLLRAFGDESHSFAIVLLGIVVLGLFVTLRIAEYLLGVGSVHGVMGAVGLAIAVVLNGALIMGLFFATHRTVLAGRDPMLALHDSFMACRQHAGAIATLIAVFLGIGVLILGAFQLSKILGYLLLYTVGLVTLPVLVCASYQSYRDIFPTA